MEILERVEELGFQRGSSVFVNALLTMSSLKKTTVEGKLELIKSIGLSPNEILKTLRRMPSLFEFGRKGTSRSKVWKMLKCKGLVNEGELKKILMLSEERFLRKYVTTYEKQVPNLLKAYNSRETYNFSCGMRMVIVEIPFKTVLQEAAAKLGCAPPNVHQKSSKKKAEESAASHPLKVLQDLGVTKVIDVNSCDDLDEVVNLKKHGVFSQEEMKKLKASTQVMKNFSEARIKGCEKKIEELKFGEGSSIPMRIDY
ncbi:transcription termination factor MTERF6, chloroplastic/mitochondrial-like protein [Cinnamomum micranthum f. kanehirae]|uniref:Transcription termination factor MTERF6, chloroplastic/mitochondrial-like protein n=1 Tax=Cinnamomum micranthum f. kanehirae TaxID=337451 RepID=A0A3S3MJH3_9MAGN|nr:transcription termination factor MTERF6, chloroplastic/mitochondrial-like protein [Cinnamomum micranthum f. kanehirae]